MNSFIYNLSVQRNAGGSFPRKSLAHQENREHPGRRTARGRTWAEATDCKQPMALHTNAYFLTVMGTSSSMRMRAAYTHANSSLLAMAARCDQRWPCNSAIKNHLYPSEGRNRQTFTGRVSERKERGDFAFGACARADK